MSQKVETVWGDADFLPFIKPSFSEKTIQEVSHCFQSGWVSSGPKVRAFEEALKEDIGTPYCPTVMSGTAGLFFALLYLDLQKGDEVILPSLTFVATANAIVQAGGKPVFVEVDDTFNIDVTKIEAALTSRTRAIVPVHMTGLPADLDPIYVLAADKGLVVIEDAAQAIGAYYKGQRIGSFGQHQVFSFQATKNLACIEGGAISTREEQFAQFVEKQRFHGIDRDAWNRFAKKGSQVYDVIAPGYKSNLPDVNAAVGLVQLAELKANQKRRDVIAQRYRDAFSHWEEIILQDVPKYKHQHGYHLFVVQINEACSPLTRDAFMAAMKENNIGTGLHYAPVHLYSYYREKFGYQKGDLPTTENICKQVVSLPFFPTMSDDDQERVINTMSHLLRKGNH